MPVSQSFRTQYTQPSIVSAMPVSQSFQTQYTQPSIVSTMQLCKSLGGFLEGVEKLFHGCKTGLAPFLNLVTVRPGGIYLQWSSKCLSQRRVVLPFTQKTSLRRVLTFAQKASLRRVLPFTQKTSLGRVLPFAQKASLRRVLPFAQKTPLRRVLPFTQKTSLLFSRFINPHYSFTSTSFFGNEKNENLFCCPYAIFPTMQLTVTKHSSTL